MTNTDGMGRVDGSIITKNGECLVNSKRLFKFTDNPGYN